MDGVDLHQTRTLSAVLSYAFCCPGMSAMHRRIGKQSTGKSAQFAIAAFDEWGTLRSFLEERNEARSGSDALLHARKDEPPPSVQCGLLQDMIRLKFAGSPNVVRCTPGPIADKLAAGSMKGRGNLADVLHVWMNSEQAWELESHLEKGCLVLWLELRTSEEFGDLCGRLVQASPHLVDLCTIKLDS